MSESGGDPALINRTVAGKFVVEKFLGGGAMGAVYRAHQVSLDKKIALKVMHRSLATDEAFVMRFHREARAASKLDHPNSMRVVDFGEEPDGLLYIAMEYLEGRDLFRVIHEDWPLSNDRIADVLMQALAAIAVAHDQGVIHRDLKPENVMILRGKNDEGRDGDVVKVCDFGIAKITEGDEPSSTATPGNPAARKLTTQGLVVGTPEYMSPEQARGEKLDPRSDLYSLGIMLYQLLTGRTPFVADSPLAVVLKHISEVPKPPHEIYAQVHQGLEAVCLRAIAKDREARFQNAREMRAAIRAAIDGKPVALPISHAPTVPLPAVESGPNLQAPTAPAIASSKVTPLGTEAAPPPKPRAFPRVAAVVVVCLMLGAGGAYAAVHLRRWPQLRCRARTLRPRP
jgi:serine/threonine protein kinase